MQAVCNKPLYITLSDFYEQINHLYAARAQHNCTGTSKAFIFSDKCLTGLRSVQCGNQNQHFTLILG